MNTSATDTAIRQRAGQAPKSRIRLPWLLVAATAFLLATVSVLWALGRVADRKEVLVVREPVSVGQPITDDVLGTAQVALDDGYGRVYEASQRSIVVGAIASIDLEPGDFLGPTVLNRQPITVAGERLVGVKLPQGKYPTDLRQGDQAVAVATFVPESDEKDTVPARIVDVTISETFEAILTLAVNEADAPRVAVWAGEDLLVIVTTPQGAGS
jgi:hypothetical protein